MNQAEYARHRGVTPAAVSQAVRDGRIHLERGGGIDPARADREWADNTDTDKPRNSVTGDPKARGKVRTNATASLQRHKARRARTLADMDELELRKVRGELLVKVDVERAEFARGRRVLDLLLEIPGILADIFADETDAAVIHRAMTEEIRRACKGLAVPERR